MIAVLRCVRPDKPIPPASCRRQLSDTQLHYGDLRIEVARYQVVGIVMNTLVAVCELMGAAESLPMSCHKRQRFTLRTAPSTSLQ